MGEKGEKIKKHKLVVVKYHEDVKRQGKKWIGEHQDINWVSQ